MKTFQTPDSDVLADIQVNCSLEHARQMYETMHSMISDDPNFQQRLQERRMINNRTELEMLQTAVVPETKMSPSSISLTHLLKKDVTHLLKKDVWTELSIPQKESITNDERTS
jgi:hypothetical protein